MARRCLAVGCLAIGGLLTCSPARSADEIDFTRDVVPALTKAGCNMGACHGSFQGRGGLRLSLLGFDPAADYDVLVKEARGRRVFPAAPRQSLILKKPVLDMPHGGGRRLQTDDPAYQVLLRWIESGAPPPRLTTTETSPLAHVDRVVKLEVTPAEALLAAGQQTQLQVVAHWSDGEVRDVTPWALYESKDDRVAEVTPTGQITSAGAGRVAIIVRYMGQVMAVPMTTPFTQPAGDVAATPANFIDDLVAAEWDKLGLRPAPLCDDRTFFRRVYIDLIGTVPTPAELQAFLASPAPDKRARLIDELLARPEYVDYWAIKWSDLLRAHRRVLGDKGLASFRGWLTRSLRENVPADLMARQLLTAEGNLYTSGPVAFYFVDKTPEELAETTAQVFLGLRMQCAKCHHHPFEVWGQDDYYGLAAFFSRIDRKDTKEAGMYGGAQSIRLAATGAMKHPITGQEVPPRALGWNVPAEQASGDVRRALAEWITSPDNRLFARNIVNRYWGYMLGRGLVEPIDDLSAANPAVMPSVLDALAADFVAHGHDLQHLLRTMCNSRVYQLQTDLAPATDAEGKYFTHHLPRRMPAEVLLDAINQAAGTVESFKDLPPGTRAISLADPAVDSYFLETFGRPNRTSTCECERVGKADLSQVLHLANGEAIHNKVIAPQGRLSRLVEQGRSDAEIIDELYLVTLTRSPDADELATASQFVAAAPNRREGLEDLLWTLLNCPEFAFNH
ncbi:MAG: DUF1549 domain-containing protein [Pirellulales bacterium]